MTSKKKGSLIRYKSPLAYVSLCRCLRYSVLDQAYPGGGGSPWLVECIGERWSTTGGSAGEASWASTAAVWGGVGAEVVAGAGAGGVTCGWGAVVGTLVAGGLVGSNGSCCLECGGLTSWGRGGGGAACWTCLRACLVYPVSFLKLFTACMKKNKRIHHLIYSNFTLNCGLSSSETNQITQTKIQEFQSYLSKELIGNEIIRWNIWLFACEADMLLWVQ